MAPLDISLCHLDIVSQTARHKFGMATETGVGLSEFSDIVEHEFGMDNGDDIEEDFVSARKRKRPCALPTLQFTLIDSKTFVFSSFFLLPNM